MTPNPEMEAKHSTSVHKQIAEDGLIIEIVAGSQLLGTNVDGSDHDSMGVCIEPPQYTLGLRKFENYIGRSKPMGQRSTSEDTDRTIYSLRKFCSLALKGNPTILNLFYAPQESILFRDWWGVDLQNKSRYFASRQAGTAFLGYMAQQRERLEGVRGQKNVKRPELEEKYGFDTKYASHIIRLGFQGIDFLTYGCLNLPLKSEQRGVIRAIREGGWSKENVLLQASAMERQIEDLLTHSPLPEEPAYDAVNAWLARTYIDYYDQKGWLL